jgi:hypothetical protein
MKRVVLLMVCMILGAGAAFADTPISLGAFKQRTQVGVGFQHEWLSTRGEEAFTPKKAWVAVVPASFNLTPSTDLIGQVGYNFNSKAVRTVIGVRVVVWGK